MSENKTSQAVRDMSDRCSKWFQAADASLGDRVTIPWGQWQAYAAKYQDMEKALEELELRLNKWPDYDHDDVSHIPRNALAYDPLFTESPQLENPNS